MTPRCEPGSTPPVPASGPWLVVGFGAPPEARRRVVEAMGPDARWAVVVHAAAWVSPSARVEPGAVVLAGCGRERRRASSGRTRS